MTPENTWIFLTLFALLGVILVAAIQFALCFLKPLIFKLVPLIALVIIWASAHLGMWRVNAEFLANGERFIMMAITPPALAGMAIGWGLYHAIQTKRKRQKD